MKIVNRKPTQKEKEQFIKMSLAKGVNPKGVGLRPLSKGEFLRVVGYSLADSSSKKRVGA